MTEICNFCKKTRREVGAMVRGADSYICNECLSQCLLKVAEHIGKKGVTASGPKFTIRIDEKHKDIVEGLHYRGMADGIPRPEYIGDVDANQLRALLNNNYAKLVIDGEVVGSII